MSADAGQPIRREIRRDLWRLPEVLNIRTLRRHLPERRRITSRGEDRWIEEAIEIEIEVSEPFEIRALGPALWVGDEPLTVAEETRPRTYRFLVTRPELIQEGAPIELAWNTPRARRVPTNYHYSLPPEDETGRTLASR